jgi:hypothetical protein
MNEAQLRMLYQAKSLLSQLLRDYESQNRALGIAAEEREAKEQARQRRLMAQSEVLGQ